MGEGWRRLVPLALILLILILAPVLAYGQSADTVVVHWTAPGDDGDRGIALVYDLRVSESPITVENFEQALRVFGMPAPIGAGTRQQVTVRGLTRGTTYYFAIRSTDDVGNRSELSNVTRWDWVLDAAPPGSPNGLALGHGKKGGKKVSWAPNPEPDLVGYRVYRAALPKGPYTLITPTPIVETEFEDPAPPPDVPVLWYRVTAVDANGNESAASASVSIGSSEITLTTALTIEESYPNPATIWTPVRIPVVVPASGASHVFVEVLDSGNRRVRRIDVGNLSSGRHEIVWDGRNDVGQVCAPGVYRGWFVTDTDRRSIRLVRVP
jgi:hypothetical protein